MEGGTKSQSSAHRDPERIKRTRQQAQNMAFTTQLFYFSMKTLFCYILTQYHTVLNQSYIYIAMYVLLLATNTYMIATTGRDPGYQQSAPEHRVSLREDQSEGLVSDELYCDICRCRQKLRTKHCFRCGRCVRKYDHHCPWIGACVGEANHLRFCLMTLLQTAQSLASLLICFRTMQLYEYKDDSEGFNQEFGVFAIFALFMFFYTLFVGGLFLFHAYLIACNLTTTELIRRGKAAYLKDVQGNPFNQGIIQNCAMSIAVPAQGHEWRIGKPSPSDSRPFMSRIFSNSYYQCC